ncbi:MAG: hypothetical protein AAF830_00805 [Pseudomonadota bacterium]
MRTVALCALRWEQRQLLLCSLALFVACIAQTSAFAQNTGGVFGPIVREGHRGVEYRLTYDPSTDGYAHRLHIEEATTDRLMWRLVAQNRNLGQPGEEFDFVQAELFTQLTEDQASVQHGLRFDARVRSNNRPHFLAASYMNQFDILAGVGFRTVVLMSKEFGPRNRGGANIETRNQLNFRAENGTVFGLEAYNVHGSTADDFASSAHQVGGFTTFPLGQHGYIQTSALFGINRNAPDTNLRMWLGLRF